MHVAGRILATRRILSGGNVRTLLTIGLAALSAIGFLAILVAQIASEARSTEEFSKHLDWSVETRGLLRIVSSVLQDAETGERGFILPFEKARTAAHTVREQIDTIAEQIARC